MKGDGRRRAAGAGSTAAHVAALLIVIWLGRHPRGPAGAPAAALEPPARLVWLVEPGVASGGGGGGNRSPAPPRPAERTGRDRLTMPAQPDVVATPDPAPAEPAPPLEVPAQPVAAGVQALPGVAQPQPADTASLGAGGGRGAGEGTGSGSGPGTGPGLGPGAGGGTGGAYHAGNGVTSPTLLMRVPPEYTADAMRARMQGVVILECVVEPDGRCGDVRVVRSLDRTFGLDQKAIDAARKWVFRPGTRLGDPVPVFVTLEMEFGLR
jgi:protein TonB